MNWAECQPDIAGVNAEGLSRAVERIRDRSAIAQICVLQDDHVILDRMFGCEPKSLFWIFSASKPFMAMLIYLLAERGQLRLDDPLALHWPEFAQNDKATITTRHVLQHRSGIVERIALRDVTTISNWERSVRQVERSRPIFAAGDQVAYLPVSYGFILGGLIERITHVPVRDCLSTELLSPLKMHNTFLGLPDEQWKWHVPVSAPNLAGKISEFVLNRRAIRNAIIPAAGISTTARDLALFYQMLLHGGETKLGQLLQPSSIDMARIPSCNGEVDHYAKIPIHWAQGFQLGGSRSDPHVVSPFGRSSSPRTFGHNGSNCCIAWADPTRKLVFVYLSNILTSRKEGAAHLAAVADDVISACTDDGCK